MNKLFAPMALFLLSLPALAADLEDAAASAPVDTVDMVYVVLFIVLFIGTIAGFLLYFLWRDDSREKRKQ
jgi:ABC-type methionine transport system permease subunit